jgi:uncharacterized protein with NAD-binding domain and iron-sulfur cluster
MPAPDTESPKKKKIAILGGGLGGISSAYWLTEKTGWQNEYEITVYQMGWRLGGKGASGRNLIPGYGHRIEEHGLHMFFGFYHNAFRMLRDVYDELNALPDSERPVRIFPECIGEVSSSSAQRAAFEPQSVMTLGGWVGNRFAPWEVLCSPNAETPGSGRFPTLWETALELLGDMRNVFGHFLDRFASTPAARGERTLWGLLSGRFERLLELPAQGVMQVLHSAIWLARSLPADPRRHHHSQHRLLVGAIDLFLKLLRRLLGHRLATDDDARHFFVLMDLAGRCLIGMIEDEIFEKGFESIDDLEFREWLRSHGADRWTLDSAILGSCYDLVFGFEDGDTGRPNCAAGTALLGLISMLFRYNGAFAYRMQAGMGDTIFTPLYGLLLRRGVRFEFFHRVDRLKLSEDDPGLVEEIHLTRQVELEPKVRERPEGYWPLLRVGALDCWPSEPLLEQIVDGEKLAQDPAYPYNLEWNGSGAPEVGRRVLHRKDGFDHVVLAISIGALPRICADLVERHPRWRHMLEGTKTRPGVSTVRTQACQLWLNRTAEQMGWTLDRWIEARKRADPSEIGALEVLTGYANPLNTWADMSQVMKSEDWPTESGLASIAYLCGPLAQPEAPHHDPEPYYQVQQNELAKRTADDWLRAHAHRLWPDACSRDAKHGLREGYLVAPPSRPGGDPFARQYFRANVDPSERYVLSLAGTTRLRLPADGSGVRNLTLAGDWIRNPVLSAGFAEAAAASGMAAARAISGFPRQIVGER